MNTSKVTSSNMMVVSSKSNGIVGQLEKQKMQLTKEIEKVNAGTENSKTKAEKIKGINDQITELDKQIQQAKFDEQQQEMEKNQQKSAEKAEQEKYDKADDSEKQGVVLSASLNNLLVANNNNHQVKEMGRARTKLQGEINVAQGQIKHALSGSSTQYQMDVVSENGNTLSELEGKIGKKMGQVKKDIDKSLKTGIAEAEKKQANKKQAEAVDGKKVNIPQDEPQAGQVIGVTDASNVMAMQENEIDNIIEKKNKLIDILA